MPQPIAPPHNSFLRKAVAYSLYTLLLAGILATIVLAIHYQWDFKAVYWKATVVLVLTLILVETFLPLSRAWSMTGKSFLRDLSYIIFVGPTIGLTKAAIGWLLIGYSQSHTGPMANWPVVMAAGGFLLIFEFFQYWFHRISHGAQGPLGQFLWRIHLAHHLPDRVYVMMHAVFHPLNALISATIIQVPLLLLGAPPAAILAATLLIDLQSLVSHFNVDIRAGWFNYLFIGTETHRFHHSAKLEDASNFGNTLAIWDVVFGTFRYRPGQVPEKLGVEKEGKMPESRQVLKVLTYAFHS
jgi:sterol desaturase/sphingolipid hydroxylase (fatty acid hydroxylase superfamily)